MIDRRLGTLTLIHGLGLMVATVTYLLWEKWLGVTPSLLILSLIWGGVAAVSGRLLGWGMAFFVLNLVAPVLCGVVLTWALPSWLFPVLLILAAGVYWNAVAEGVPLYLSNSATQAAVSDLVGDTGARRVIDLGCGLGGLVSHVAKAHPEAVVAGVETAPLSYVMAKLRCRHQPNAQISATSLWQVDLKSCDLVYCFLSPVPMSRLFEKVQAEMRPGSVFVSNSFDVDGFPADEVRELSDARRTKLHIWRIGEKRRHSLEKGAV